MQDFEEYVNNVLSIKLDDASNFRNQLVDALTIREVAWADRMAREAIFTGDRENETARVAVKEYIASLTVEKVAKVYANLLFNLNAQEYQAKKNAIHMLRDTLIDPFADYDDELILDEGTDDLDFQNIEFKSR